MPVSLELLVNPIHPLGASVHNLDISNHDHLSRLPSLLYASGFLLLPANSQPPNAPALNTVDGLSKIASCFGTIETEHPVLPHVRNSLVQKLETTSSTADAYIFHSDMTWNTSPSLVAVLCMVQLPETGGDTCFRSSTQLFEALSPDLKQALGTLSFINSLNMSYGTVKQGHMVKKERCGLHPGVIRHPVTGKPCFYVNENTTKKVMGVNVIEGDQLMRRAFEQGKHVGVYRHKWAAGDIVIWDNMGVQHMAMNDYREKRVVYRASVTEKWFRPDRFVAERGVEEGVRDIRKRMEGDAEWVYDEEVARVYEHDMRECGYRLPEIVAEQIIKQVEAIGSDKEMVKVLDVGAGTGLFGIALMKTKTKIEVFKVDAVDRSEAMAHEAKRRMIYEEYNLGDVNESIKMFEENGMYDAVVCVDGLSKNEIKVEIVLQDMVKVTKKGGVIILTVNEGMKQEVVREVDRLVGQGDISVVADYAVIGFQAMPEVGFNVIVLSAS